MKIVLGIIILFIIGWGIYAWWTPTTHTVNSPGETSTTTTEDREQMVVTVGNYIVDVNESTFTWAGKKPLISGYINSGSVAVTEGMIRVDEDTATGTFTIDMDTLSVFDTPTKPGEESTLEEHLKGERWFNVETYPNATFVITEVTPRPDSNTTFIYDVRGDLTMKGQTHELTFPATIYQDAKGLLHASADFEFDRTKWGITSGSGSFFDDLADNVIDDMVALSFDLVAAQ